MSQDARKPVFDVSDKVPNKPACIVSAEGQKLEILEKKRKKDLHIHEMKIRALISCAVNHP